jgi:hypothetical protein
MSAEFITGRVHLLPGELARGYRLGYLDEATVVELAEDAFRRGDSETTPIGELAILLSDELDRVPDLLEQIDTMAAAADPDPSLVWLFLVLAQAYDRRGLSEDPLADLEAIYAEFGYPEEIEGFVPFLPAPEGQPSGPDAIQERWRAYLDERSLTYARRTDGSDA